MALFGGLAAAAHGVHLTLGLDESNASPARDDAERPGTPRREDDVDKCRLQASKLTAPERPSARCRFYRVCLLSPAYLRAGLHDLPLALHGFHRVQARKPTQNSSMLPMVMTANKSKIVRPAGSAGGVEQDNRLRTALGSPSIIKMTGTRTGSLDARYMLRC